MYCIHCGAKICDDSRFCTECGKSVEPGITTVSDIVKDVLANLKDNDIQVPNSTGELRISFSNSQNKFFHLIKKGLLILTFILLPGWLQVARADGSVSGVDSNSPLKVKYQFTGGNINPEMINDRNGMRHYNGTVRPGDTVSVTYTMTDGSGNGNGLKDWNHISVTITPNSGKAAYDKEIDCETFPTISGKYVVQDTDETVKVSVYASTSWFNQSTGSATVHLGYSVIYKVVHNGSSTKSSGNKFGCGTNDDKGSRKKDKVKAKITGPQDYTIDTDADDSRDWRSWGIPAAIITIGTILISQNTGKGKGKNKKSKKTKETPKKEDDEEEEDEEESYKYELRIAKHFGDTIYAGDAPKGVYAYIARVDKYGTETTDEQLTRMIRISGDDYLRVTDVTYQEGTQSANVSAPALANDHDVPKEGIITFTIATANGSFSNRMHFKIEVSQIIFLQDELIIPACEDRTLYYPFEVDGLEDPIVELSMSDSTYSVSLENDRENGLYYAVITENDKMPGKAGEKTKHDLTITAKCSGGSVVTRKLPIYRFNMGLVCRDLDHIDCFVEEDDPMKHMIRDFVIPGKIDMATNIHDEPVWRDVKIAPAETEFRLTLYDYDEESNSILVIPPAITSYTIVADDLPSEYLPKEAAKHLDYAAQILGATSMGGAAAALQSTSDHLKASEYAVRQSAGAFDLAAMVVGMSGVSTYLQGSATELAKYRNPTELAQEAIDNLGIKIGLAEVFSEDDPNNCCVQCRFICTQGVLQKPNRIKATVHIEAEHNGRKYFVDQPVILRSQPLRCDLDYAEKKRLYERDELALEGLQRLDSEIYRFLYWKDLDQLQALIHNIIDNYDNDYGVDWQQVRAIFRIYNNFIAGKQDEAHMMDNPSCYFTDTVDKMLKMGKWTEDKLGFWGRLAVGVASFGITEGVFNSLEVLEMLKRRSDKGLDNVYLAWCYASWVPIREYLFSYVTDAGAKKVKAWLNARKAGKQIAEEAAAKAARKAAKDTAKKGTATTAKKSAETTASKATKEGAERVCHIGNQAERAAAAEKTARNIARDSEQKALASARNVKGQNLGATFADMVQTEEIALVKAQKEIDDFAAMLTLSKGEHTEKIFLKAVEMQQNKHVLELLQFSQNPGIKDIRKMFNYEMALLHSKIHIEMRYNLCQKYRFATGGNMDSIQLLKITSSDESLLTAGEKITFDFDGTYYIEMPNGSKHFFTQNEIQESYAEALYKIVKNEDGTMPEYLEFMKKCDQSVIQADYHPDSYGMENALVMTDPKRMAEALPDVELAAKTTEYKCLEWWEEGVILWKTGVPEMKEVGVAKMRESFRQCYKQFYNFTVKRNGARVIVNGKSVIPDNMYTLMQLFKQTDVAPSGSMKVGELLFVLHQMGTSPEQVFSMMRKLTLEIG